MFVFINFHIFSDLKLAKGASAGHNSAPLNVTLDRNHQGASPALSSCYQAKPPVGCIQNLEIKPLSISTVQPWPPQV